MACTIRLITIDRVRSIETAAVQFIDDDGLTAFLLDIDGNGTVNSS